MLRHRQYNAIWSPIALAIGEKTAKAVLFRARCNKPINKTIHTLMPQNLINAFVFRYIAAIEMIGVLMRIFSFSLVSWLGADSPFFFVWAFNTTDALILSWCALLKKDKAYTVLNIFWIMVGVVGMLRASAFSFPEFKTSVIHGFIQFASLFNQ